MASIFITGGAGFIGYHLQKHLEKKHQITAIDLLDKNNYAATIRSSKLINIEQGDIKNSFLKKLKIKPEVVIHLAAETGISGSLNNPKKYIDTNINGTFNVLEQCKKNGVKYLIYASSSSVYNPNQAEMDEESATKNQLSFYGTTKKMGEIMIENYCKQFGITAIGLRFFTVYGSWTRPDMAAYKFMKTIQSEKSITLYNEGNIFRDFTHVSDIVKSIELLIEKIQEEKTGTHQIFNIGYGSPISVKKYADLIAKALDKELFYKSAPLPKNELEFTHSNTLKLENYINFKPQCAIEEGVKEMTDWFKKEQYEQ
ncbi:NAD-dependent epimerase/dehydratase family protein [Flavobacterium sp. 123]|uniref:NAD-dependent epimerase/dehydratase family protein n=1 Tax=Flavobacterium sp. 123 TaxID=2135627 RepID=UPI000EAF51B0|nr:NAD-dependent epimerase/dehydratase family protein [Flavobacterium sp. 123]RKS99663.1 UDP-glucuronate 4-epimerase [Flavobacterium sp. 123]